MDKDIKEKIFIGKRKWMAFCYSIVFYVCRLFPIKQNKIVFWTFEGTRGFCCNPRYIAQEILDRKQKCELVWLVENMQFEFPQGIKKVRNTLWNRAYQLSTSRIWVGNSRTIYGTKKRKGQIYIQTWHGTVCIKPIGLYRGELFPKIAKIVSKADSDLIDYVLSGSDWCDIHYPKGLLYDGKIIRTGTPRCDALVNNRDMYYQKIRAENKLPANAKILLYAPTFRGGSQSTDRFVSSKRFTIEFENLIQTLEEKFGGKWFIFLRLHPQLAMVNQADEFWGCSDRRVDVTQKQDMNELIAGADAFISDYSSAIFEAALLRIPCFIYADDLEKYVEERGKLFFEIEQLPFSAAVNNADLLENIASFRQDEYEHKLAEFMEREGIDEDGHASERVVDMIQALVRNE